MSKILNCLLGAALFATLLPISSFASRNTINLDSTFNGKITRKSNGRDTKQFIFYDDATGMNYFLNSNRVGRTFDNQDVKITGRLGRHSTLHVDVVQPVEVSEVVPAS
jgi:hypothetical protein